MALGQIPSLSRANASEEPRSCNGKRVISWYKVHPPNQLYQSECGFDFRLSSPTARWGAGTYFAASAMYSHAYAYTVPNTSHQQMILAKVLTGASCTLPPDGTLKRPPPKPADSRPAGRVQFLTAFYDSVMGMHPTVTST